LLRPPVELYSATVSTAAGTLALLAPWAFFMTPSVARCAAVVFFALAVVRGHAGFCVLRYQRNLKRLPLCLPIIRRA
jgi:hypothetical protein